jgi:hypothetical protein
MNRISDDGFLAKAIMLSTPENRFNYGKVAAELHLSPDETTRIAKRLQVGGRIECPRGTEWVIVGADAAEAAAWRANQKKVKG